jgi:hypothetical protein
MEPIKRCPKNSTYSRKIKYTLEMRMLLMVAENRLRLIWAKCSLLSCYVYACISLAVACKRDMQACIRGCATLFPTILKSVCYFRMHVRGHRPLSYAKKQAKFGFKRSQSVLADRFSWNLTVLHSLCISIRNIGSSSFGKSP